MDTSTIIMGIILIAIVVIPIMLMEKKGKKAKHSLLKILTAVAEQNNCNISEYGMSGDFIIGIDKQKKQLFFIEGPVDTPKIQIINLKEFKSCKLRNISREVNFKGESNKVIDRLYLDFIPGNNNVTGVELEFYNSQSNSQLYDELHVLEKWHKIISGQIG